MSVDELLALARAGDLEAFAARRDEVPQAIAHLHDERALELVGRTWRVWSTRGELDEGAEVAAAALAAFGGESVWRVRVLCADGLLAFRAGDRDRSLSRNEDALALARRLDDVQGECEALTGLARIALRDGRYDDVLSLAASARARAQAAGDRAAEAAPLHLQAAGAHLRQEYDTARALYLESLSLNAELGNGGWVKMEQHNLGWIEVHRGDVDSAAGFFTQRDEGADRDAYGDAWHDINWAAVSLVRGDAATARGLFDSGMHSLESMGMALDPDDQFEVDWLRDRLARGDPGS